MTRTSLVLLIGGRGTQRGVLPEDLSPEELAEGKSKQGFRIPTFIPAHMENRSQVISLDPFKMKKVSEHVPDQISFDSRSFDIDGMRGGKLRKQRDGTAIYVLPPEIVEQVDQLDKMIDDLGRQRNELLKSAPKAGRLLTRWECRQLKKKEAGDAH